MSKKVFTSQKIRLIVAGREFRVQALVSTFGAKYVLEQDEVPQELRDRLGENIQVFYKDVACKARLVRETTPAGVVFNVRFLNPSNSLLSLIDRDIHETGLPSPWIRALPRLSTEPRHLPLPILAVLYRGGSTSFLNVKNFTLGGVLLEHTGEDLARVMVGDRFEFDLVTNFGDKIADVTGVVSHVTVEITADANEARHYFFGIRFLPMSLGTVPILVEIAA